MDKVFEIKIGDSFFMRLPETEDGLALAIRCCEIAKKHIYGEELKDEELLDLCP